MPVILEFEKPLYELEEKVRQLREFSKTNHVDVDNGVRLMEERIAATRQKVFAELSAWQRIQLARHPERPFPRDYANRLFTDFLELHGDRRFADDHAIIGGFAKLDGAPVMFIGSQKGRNLKENVKCRFGCANPEGYRKALRLMQLADKAGVPIVIFIDTPGAYPGVGGEERHVAEAIAVNLREMFTFGVPVVCVVTGEGGSGGALGIGVGNRVLILEYSYYSVITPEGCAAILWRDPSAAPQAAEALKLTGPDLLKHGIVDAVVPEPLGGAHRAPDEAAKLLGEAVRAQLAELRKLTPDQLREQRYGRFRKLGVFEETGAAV
ncbi:MAG: acetyl-CoA carboxylase carboxyltransferase subunit alpha [Lentisphaeria bacterium]|jgi:acetyl-CoA carboxylase carboxyl transferase subunit alpha